jgi:hypothetical protein
MCVCKLDFEEFVREKLGRTMSIFWYIFHILKKLVLMSLAQLVWTMHNICKVRGSNPDHHKKKIFKKLKEQYSTWAYIKRTILDMSIILSLKNYLIFKKLKEQYSTWALKEQYSTWAYIFKKLDMSIY